MSSQILEPLGLEVKNPKTSKMANVNAAYSGMSNPSTSRPAKGYGKLMSDAYIRSRLQTHMIASQATGLGWTTYLKPSYARTSHVHRFSQPIERFELPTSDFLWQSLANIRVRIGIYLSIVAALAISNVYLIVLQAIPSAVAIPVLGGLAVALLLSTAFVLLIGKEPRVKSS